MWLLSSLLCPITHHLVLCHNSTLLRDCFCLFQAAPQTYNVCRRISNMTKSAQFVAFFRYARLPFSMPFEWVGNLCGLLTMYLFSVANLTTLSHFTSFTRCRGNEVARVLFLRCPSKGYIASPSRRVSMSRWTCSREFYAISIQPGQTQPCPVLGLCLCCSWPSSPWCFPLLMEQHSRKGALSFSAIQVTFLALALPTMRLHRLWTALH